MGGSGYPDGLSEHGIPVVARLIAVADTLDAVTHRRSHAPETLDIDDAVELVAARSGIDFDPALVTGLVARHRDDPRALRRALSLRDVAVSGAVSPSVRRRASPRRQASHQFRVNPCRR